MRTTESSLNFSRRFAASALGLLLRFFFFFFLFLFLHLLIISLLLHTNNRPAGSAQPGLETAATGDVDQGVHAMAAASVWGSFVTLPPLYSAFGLDLDFRQRLDACP